MGPWKRALIWFIPVLAWASSLVFFARDFDSRRRAVRNASFEPDQNLGACLDFAQDNFSKPSPTQREACYQKLPEDQAIAAREKAKETRGMMIDGALAVFALALMGAYFLFVPKGWRAGFRVWLFVIVGGAILGTLALFVVLSGMPRGD